MASRHRREQHNFNLHTPPALAVGADAQEGQEQRLSPDGQVRGKIEVSPRAIAHLASRAAQRCYGVVGLASRTARPGWAELLRREEEHKGVQVAFIEDGVVIDLYVIIEYGTRISEVARNIMGNVKFAIASALGADVVRVNVTVQGIRVSS